MEKVPVIIEEYSGIDRTDEPVTVGVPLPKGCLKNGESLTLINSSGEAVPLQAAPLAFWPDQSVKWMLLDFQPSVRAREVSQYHLIIGADPGCATKAISIDRYENGLKVDTGVTTYYLDGKAFLPFSRVISGGIDVVDKSNSTITLVDSHNREFESVVEEVLVETPGRLRTTIKIEGFFRRKNRRLACFVSRLHFYANKSFAKMDFTLWNSRPARHTGGLWDLGDPGSIFFKDLSLHIALNSEDKQSTIRYYLREDPVPMDYQKEHENYELSAKSYELNGRSHLLIYQDSSGGENWQSSNHVNRSGKVPLKFKGYQVKERERVISQGSRACPLVYIGDGKRGISGTIQKFWQNFPKALEADGKRISIRLFPRFFGDLHEFQGGEKKTHTIFLDFGREPHGLNWVHNPLIPIIPPEWYSKTKAIPYLSVDHAFSDDRYETLIGNVVKGNNTFFHRREIIDEYGWRNFGEVYADHEAVRHTESSTFVSHYNNQYDLIFGFIFQYIRKSDITWYHLMDDLTRHVLDIDIYDTDLDREEFNGGMLWHTNHHLDAATCTHRSVSEEHLKLIDPKFCGGGPGLEHNYTTGLLFHYYITGDISSREAMLKLADWVMRCVDLPNTILGTLYDFKKNLPKWIEVLKGTKVRADRYPLTRASGNSINALIDAYCLTYNRTYLKKAEKIIKGCIHPHDDIDSRAIFNDPEGLWSYTVALQAICKYLYLKKEIGEIDDMYCYARESLLHYAEWMLENEYAFLEKPETLQIPNETWSGQDLRKSSIFYYAAKYCNNNVRNAYLEKARFFFNHSIQELYTFETGTLVRPIALMLQNSNIHFYFLENPTETGPDIDTSCDLNLRREFLSPFLIAKQIVKEITKALRKTSLKKEIHWLNCRMNKHI